MQKTKQSIYKRMQKFADLTNKMIAEKNINRVKKAFNYAEELLLTGNNELKNAVLNVYLFSISSKLEIQDEEGRKVLNYLPGLLRQGYHCKIVASYHE